MMAESLESRKSERKQQFDLPLPVRSKPREPTAGGEAGENAPDILGGTMAFSLLTKKGNRQQVCNSRSHRFLITNTCQTRTVALPSDSHFAIAMKTQQQAEKEEQQRIKNLVLNYDLRDNDDQDGEADLAPLKPNTNIHNISIGSDKPTSHHYNRAENKTAKERGGQRVRKLQLSDVDWYDKSQKTSSPSEQDSGSASGPRPPSRAAAKSRWGKPLRSTR